MNIKNYKVVHLNDCLALFDQHCPEFFAPNERKDYQNYLTKHAKNYRVVLQETKVTAAFGIHTDAMNQRGRVTWIMVAAGQQGSGLGKQMMDYTKQYLIDKCIQVMDIAASHLSAPFFKKFGAREINTIKNGWGKGMHRVDMELTLL